MIYSAVQGLIDHSLKSELITEEDVIVVRNLLMNELHLTEWKECAGMTGSVEQILNSIVSYACENEIIENTAVKRDLFDTRIMGIVTPMPREVNRIFKSRYAQSPEAASEWYYDFSRNLNYVRADRIARDKKWTFDCEYGVLDVTINLSKPEKDPKDIAAAKNRKASEYPKCQLCAENMGFAGHLTHPARQNLRPVPLDICDSKWYLQYSPYGYYNEHCILFNSEHIPMVIDYSAFEKLFDFLDIFPHYFIGSNADLPIVGGSILTHEHFQGGNYTFAMEKAPAERAFKMSGFENVSAGIVKWPVSVIRLSSEDRKELASACSHVLEKWRNWNDEKAGIISETDGTPHNTVTPITRKRNGIYECDLVLRNNRTSEERPLGIFHPNPSLHHIKKENIGLIEVMGLAVLPSRLAVEMNVLRDSLLEGKNLSEDPRTASHEEWAAEILKSHPDFCPENADEIIRYELGKVFLEVLNDAGVFKRDAEGRKAFERFTSSL